MAETHTLSRQQAQRLTLAQQGLLKPAAFGKGPKAAAEAIQRLGYVQIDTISVINRAHHHTLWTRVPTYQPDWIHRLQAEEKTIFEYWSHAAAYLPMRDFRFSLHRKQELLAGGKHWFKRDPKVMKYVMDRITAEGPLQARDFAAPPDWESSHMWDWKPAKRALEQLFMEGQLMIAERKGFQKIFDLPERVLPSDISTQVPSQAEMARHLVEVTLQAHGIASAQEMGYLRKGPLKKEVVKQAKAMAEAGEIVRIRIKGVENDYFAYPTLLETASTRLGKKQVHFLSPFDNVVIQRKRLNQLFGFDYQIECYVPAPKRIYGYFCLPILWGDRFVGRMDAKADRKAKAFLVQSLWIEDVEVEGTPFFSILAKKLQDLAAFNGCSEIHLKKIDPQPYKSEIQAFL